MIKTYHMKKNSYLKENNWIFFLCRSQSYYRERVIGSCPSRDLAVGLRSCRVRKKSREINDNLSQPKWVAVNEQYLSLLERGGLQWAQWPMETVGKVTGGAVHVLQSKPSLAISWEVETHAGKQHFIQGLVTHMTLVLFKCTRAKFSLTRNAV